MIILSDTFYEFADPLMRQLGRPTLFCHRLLVDDDGFVRDYKLRQPDQKRAAVNALKSLNYRSSPPAIRTTTPACCWPPTPASSSTRRRPSRRSSRSFR